MSETIITKYSEDGICYPRMSINIRNIPCSSTLKTKLQEKD
mgnify:CR=1 FL=1